MKIGIFDSGLGGVTVVNDILQKYSNIDIIYFADTKRLPYGDKSNDEIINYSKQIVEFLISKDVDLIIIACNTATSVALDILKREYDINILGVIDATVKKILEKVKEKVIILATNATVNSNKYYNNIKLKNKNIDIIQIPTPLYVPLIEKGVLVGEELLNITNNYLKDHLNKKCNLVFACTHYNLLNDFFKENYANFEIIDSSIELSNDLKNYIKIDNDISNVKFYVSGNEIDFKNKLEKIMKMTNINVEKVNL